jgi:hypothetical protein
MPSYQNAVEGHRDPSLISIQPDDVVKLDSPNGADRTIESVQSNTVEVRTNPQTTEEGVTLDRVWLVQPVGLTPEELDRELKEEALINCQRQLYVASGQNDGVYLSYRAQTPNTPAPDEQPTP